MPGSGGALRSPGSSPNPVINASFDGPEAATAPPQSEEVVVIEGDSFDDSLDLLTMGDSMDIDEDEPDAAAGDSLFVDSFEKSFELNFDCRRKDSDEIATPTRLRSSSHDSAISSPLSISEDEHMHKLVSVLGNVVNNQMFAGSDVNSAVDCFTESADASTLGDILALGMGKLMIDPDANPRAISAVCHFISMVSLRTLRQDCLVPFSTIREVIDTFIERPEVFCRIRSCQLIATMFSIGEDDDDMEEGRGLPSVPVLQWCNLLSTRRLDKDAAVRCTALQAFSRLHIEKFFDHKGRLYSPYHLIASSLNDISPEVRKTAIQLLPLSSRDAISTGIRFLRDEEETPSLRLLMVERIISEVHVKSFAEKQKIELISQLCHDKDPAVRCLLGSRLVACWLRSLAEDEEHDKEGEKRLPAHPMALLKQLNCFKEEELVAMVVKLALSHFMEAAVESRTDGTAYLDFLRRMPKKLRESSGTLHKKSVMEEIREGKSDLPQRLFMHRCLLEFLCSLYPSPADLGKKDLILSRLLPNALEMCNLFKEYAGKIFAPAEACSKNQLFVFRQIGHLIRTLDLDCPIAKKGYEDTLKELISDDKVAVPLDIIEFAMDEIWVVVVKDENPEDFVEWAGFVMGTLLDSIPILQSQPKEKMDMSGFSDTEYATFLRVATIMQCVLRNPAVTTLSPLIRSAFARIANPIKVAPTDVGRGLGIKITGLVLRLDKTGSFLTENAVNFRHSILYDLIQVKVFALRALTDIIWEYGFDKFAASAFPELKEDKLKNREELAMLCEELLTQVPPSKQLSEMVFDACRLIYKCVWPKLIGAVLFRLFDGHCDTETHQVAQLFFTGFVEKGIGAKIEMIAGFMACCKFVEEEYDMGSNKFRFGCMMTFISELFGKFPLTGESPLPNKVTIEAVFAINILKKISADPRGSIQPQLACCLGSIKVEAIRGKDAKKVLEMATALTNRIEHTAGLGKMRMAVGRFAKAVEKQVDLTRGPRKNPRRRVAVKMEDFNDCFEENEGEGEVYSPSVSKRLRLCRSNSQGVWSRRDEADIKQELLSQMTVKQEPLDTHSDEPEAIVIDEDEDDLEVLSQNPPKRRRLQKIASVLDE